MLTSSLSPPVPRFLASLDRACPDGGQEANQPDQSARSHQDLGWLATADNCLASVEFQKRVVHRILRQDVVAQAISAKSVKSPVHGITKKIIKPL